MKDLFEFLSQIVTHASYEPMDFTISTWNRLSILTSLTLLQIDFRISTNKFGYLLNLCISEGIASVRNRKDQAELFYSAFKNSFRNAISKHHPEEGLSA